MAAGLHMIGSSTCCPRIFALVSLVRMFLSTLGRNQIRSKKL